MQTASPRHPADRPIREFALESHRAQQLGSPSHPRQQEDAMAKGQMRSSKEKKKPKAEWNKKKKGGPAPAAFSSTPTFTPGQGLGQHSAAPGKKG
jgi:hypothetical protein